MFGVVVALFFHAGLSRAELPAAADAATLLAQAQAARTKDHPHFLVLLKQLHERQQTLSSNQRWHLRLLDAWEASFEGDYARAEPLLRDVAAHAGDLDQQSLANGMLLNLLAIHDNYQEAFTLAEQLAAALPRLHDRQTIYVALSQLSQLLAAAGQSDAAVSYARQMEHFSPPGDSLCKPYVYLFGALDANHDLRPDDPIYRKATDACVAAGEPLYADTIELDLALREAKVGNATAALARLKRIAPSVNKQSYRVHIYALRSALGYAYWVKGDLAQARHWALAALAMNVGGYFDGLSEDVYRVLFEVEKKAGNFPAALDYYKSYRDVQVRSVNNTQAVALAYQTVHQQLAIHKLQVSELSKQNRLLALQQSLDRKAVETSRLYLALLLMVLVSIGFWLARLKRSQLKFQKLARRDSLTGILNHQHFVSEAEQMLCEAKKSSSNVCVVLMDLDYFKQINDTYGHATGDAVLIKFAAVCGMHLRPNDVFGRLGGEEFGLLLPECSLAEGVDIVDRMRVAVAATTFDDKIPKHAISASFGLASTEGSGYAFTLLRANADAALYRAKHRGRNRVETHTQSDGSA